MDHKQVLIIVLGIITALLIVASTGLYYALMFFILKQMHAPSAMWILFWSYVPVSLTLSAMARFTAELGKDAAKA